MAEKRIKGITIEIAGDTKKLGEALKGVNKQISETNAELKDLNKALKLDPKNTELLAQKQELLKKSIEATKDRLDALKEAQRQMGNYNDLTDEQKENYRALSVEISHAESNLKGLNDELSKTNKMDLKTLNNSLEGVRETTGQLVKEMAKIGTAIAGALTTLGTFSIKAYANYEQLVGGVEKLFGESSKDLVKYAEQAYKTAGISANEYLETATSFSASLIKGLNGDTQKAVALTDRAIKDMSDNANTFGSSMDEVMNVYKALSKEQYTTLDNLRLGYAGTKTGMQELIKDASKYTDIQKKLGVTVDASSMSFDNIINAISVMQEHLGIAGTTTKEAEHTIQGSINQMKASWNNLLLAISDDNADMSKSVDNFVDSVIIAGKNIVPRIKTAFEGIKKLFNSLVRDVFPKLKKEIPQLAPLINIFEWFIDHKNLVITAVKGIIAVFAVTKIVDFATKIQDTFKKITDFATGGTIQALVVTVTSLVSVATLLTDVFKSETEAQKQARLEMENHTNSLNDNLESWKSLQEAQENSLSKSKAEISHYEDLYRELQKITDENGNVKAGYEDRVDFIVNELQNAFGIEIDYVNGQIKGYQQLREEVDKLIEKKRAEAIVDSQTQAYTEAQTKKQKAIQDTIYWHDQLEQTEKDYEKHKREGNLALADIDKLHLENSRKNYEEAKELAKEYLYTINQYDSNLEALHKEEYDKIDTRTWDSVKAYENANEAKAQEEKDNYNNTKYELELLNELYEQTGNERLTKYIQNDKDILDEHKSLLGKIISETNNQKPNIFEAGVNLMNGFSSGMNSKTGSLFNTVTNIGRGLLNNFKSALKEASPSKATREMGQYLLEGISLGLKDEEKGLMDQVDDIGTGLIGGLMTNAEMAMRGLNAGIKTSLNPTINPTYAYDLNYQLMANAMKEALQEVDVELDDRKVGKFVNKVVSEEVFN